MRKLVAFIGENESIPADRDGAIASIRAIVLEQGNGFPDPEDYVQTDDQIYKVVATGNTIASSRLGNYIEAELVEADWDDCPDSDVPSKIYFRRPMGCQMRYSKPRMREMWMR